MSKIELEEADDGSQKAINGKLFVWCDCEYTDACPQGKPNGEIRCCVRIDEKRLTKKEAARIKTPQR